MNIVEIHLILNHIPIIGVAFVSAQLLVGFVCKNAFLQKVSLYFLILFALISVAVYLSGVASEDLVKTLPGVSDIYLQLHEKVARISSITVWFIGGFTFLGLLFLRDREKLFKYFARGVFVMTLVSTALFVLTGYLGGQITHLEIRSTLAEGLSSRAVSIGVVAVMALILIAMLSPLLLNRDKIFKKARGNAFEEHADRQGQGQLGKQESLVRQGSWVSIHASGETVPHKAVATMLYGEDDRLLKSQPLSPLLGQSSLPDPGIQFDFPSRPLPGFSPFSRGPLPEQETRSLPEQKTVPIPVFAESPRRQKRKKHRLLIVLSIIGLVVILAGGGGFYVIRKLNKQSPLQLQTIAKVQVANQPGRFDYESLDQKTGLLFIAYPGADSVLIFDTRSNKVVATVPGVKDGHGVVAVPDLGRVYVSAGGTNEVVAIDELTHRILARIPTGAGPDGSAYDPIDHKLFVSNEDGHSDTVIDVLREKQIGTIPLGGEAGNTQYDPVSNRIYVNVQTFTQLVAIDPKSDSIVGRYPLPSADCNHNHGLLIDAAREIAFIACDVSNTLLMVDLHGMKVLDTATLGNGPDVLALDSGRNMLYVASESGTVSIFEIRTSTVHKLAEGYVGVHAHTVAVNAQTHDIYLPLQNVNGQTIIEVAFFQT